MNILENIHNKAMDLIDQAIIERKRGNFSRALLLFREALEQETNAADFIEDEIDNEPTRSILYLSAANLAIECIETIRAEYLIMKALNGDPPDALKLDLIALQRRVLKQANVEDGELNDLQYIAEAYEALDAGPLEWNNWREMNMYRDIDLVGIDLRARDLSGINMKGVNLSEALLNGAIFDNSIFNEVDLQNSNLKGADLSSSNFQEAKLIGSDLSDVTLFNTNFTDANLTDTTLNRINFTESNILNAIFTNAKLDWSFLTENQYFYLRTFNLSLNNNYILFNNIIYTVNEYVTEMGESTLQQ